MIKYIIYRELFPITYLELLKFEVMDSQREKLREHISGLFQEGELTAEEFRVLYDRVK